MLLALLGILVVVAVANVVVLVSEHGPSEPACAPGELCNNPPVTPVALGRVWTSPELGFSFEYSTNALRVTSEDSRGVHFEITRDGSFQSDVWISGARATERSADELVRQRRDALAQRVVGLELDDGSPDRIVAPSLGSVSGAGAAYKGTLDSASGPTRPAAVAIMAAGNGTVNVVLSVLVAAPDLDHKAISSLRRAAELPVASMRWR